MRSEDNRTKSGLHDSVGRETEIRWSRFTLNGTPKAWRRPICCVMQVNNMFNNPLEAGDRWVAYENPQAVFQ